MDQKLEEIAQEHYGKVISIVGNGPTLVTMPGKDAHLNRYLTYIREKEKGVTTDINEYPQPVAMVRRLTNHPNKLWTVNGGHTYHPESSLGFLMDDHKYHRDETHPQAEWYDEQIKNSPVPIMTSKAYPAYPMLIEYPLKEVIQKFKTKYLVESIDCMCALAGLFEAKKIVFYGCDYQAMDRFPGERASTEYWIGKLEAFGIECDWSPSQNLMRPSHWEPQYHREIYGYAADTFPYTDEEINAWIRGENVEGKAVA